MFYGFTEAGRLVTDEPMLELMTSDRGSSSRARLAGQGLVESALRREQHRTVPVVRHGVMRVEFDGAFEFTLARLPVPIEPDQRGGQRRVRFGQPVVEFEGLHGGGLRARHHGFGEPRRRC